LPPKNLQFFNILWETEEALLQQKPLPSKPASVETHSVLAKQPNNNRK
jgi:hypothetical protein